MSSPPSLEAWEYTAPDGSRYRHVRSVPAQPLPLPQPAQEPLPWWARLLWLPLLGLWLAFLLHGWTWADWWAPLRWPVEAAWALGWAGTVLGALSWCLVGLGDALRR